MARLELRVLFCIVSTLAVLSQVLIDDSVIPRAWASDEELIIRYFDAGKDSELFSYSSISKTSSYYS